MSVPARNSDEGRASLTMSRCVKGEPGAMVSPKIAQVTTMAQNVKAMAIAAGARHGGADDCSGNLRPPRHDATDPKRMRGSIGA